MSRNINMWLSLKGYHYLEFVLSQDIYTNLQDNNSLEF